MRVAVVFGSLTLCAIFACSPTAHDVGRLLDRDRYVRAVRTARRIDDAATRVASEARIAERLLAEIEGEIRLGVEARDGRIARLGVAPAVFDQGEALSVELDVSAREARFPMSFRVLNVIYGGRRFVRTDSCPPAEAIALSCVDWLAGAPLEPECETIDPARRDRTTAAFFRWLSGGLVNVPAPRGEIVACARPPTVLADEARSALEEAARRIEVQLDHPPPRLTEGDRYRRTELLYAAAPPAEGRSVTIQVAVHVDRRGPPLRRAIVLRLPEASSALVAFAERFERPESLARVLRGLLRESGEAP